MWSAQIRIEDSNCYGCHKTVMAKTTDFLIYFYRALGNVVSKKLCPQKLPNDLDLVYVDYIGLKQINAKIGTLLPQFM